MSIHWLEPETNVRGSVIVVAGRGEYAGVYDRFARRIAFDGYRVAVVEGGAVDATVAVADADAALPIVVVGSDSGALTALTLGATDDAVSGVVAAGLLVDDASPTLWDDELDVRSACPVHRGVLDDAAVLERGALTVAAPGASADALAHVHVPALVIHGTADVVSSVDAVTTVVEAIPDARVVVVDGGRHDILNDVSHRSVAAEIVQFLERLRLPGAPDIVVRSTVGALSAR